MAKRYKASFATGWNMSAISFIVTGSTMETPWQEAMWHYNRAREHDGLPAVSVVPKGSKLIPLD